MPHALEAGDVVAQPLDERGPVSARWYGPCPSCPPSRLSPYYSPRRVGRLPEGGVLALQGCQAPFGPEAGGRGNP